MLWISFTRSQSYGRSEGVSAIRWSARRISVRRYRRELLAGTGSSHARAETSATGLPARVQVPSMSRRVSAQTPQQLLEQMAGAETDSVYPTDFDSLSSPLASRAHRARIPPVVGRIRDSARTRDTTGQK